MRLDNRFELLFAIDNQFLDPLAFAFERSGPPF
jgi:hypothetical protein